MSWTIFPAITFFIIWKAFYVLQPQSMPASICVAHFLCASLQKHSSKMFAVAPHFELVPAHFKNINGELDAVVCWFMAMIRIRCTKRDVSLVVANEQENTAEQAPEKSKTDKERENKRTNETEQTGQTRSIFIRIIWNHKKSKDLLSWLYTHTQSRRRSGRLYGHMMRYLESVAATSWTIVKIKAVNAYGEICYQLFWQILIKIQGEWQTWALARCCDCSTTKALLGSLQKNTIFVIYLPRVALLRVKRSTSVFIWIATRKSTLNTAAFPCRHFLWRFFL